MSGWEKSKTWEKVIATQDKSKSKFNVEKEYRKVLELTSLKSIMWAGEHKSIEKFAKRVSKKEVN